MLTKEEVDLYAKKYLKLQKRANKTKNKKHIREFHLFQNECMKCMGYIVKNHALKYKGFANYDDLVQDGFEALLHALGTYNSEKGGFAWWVNKYVSTKIARSANNHSVIKIPLKKAKIMPPYKESTMPTIISNKTPETEFGLIENEALINKAFDKLTPQQQTVVSLLYQIGDNNDVYTVDKVCKKMGISRLTCGKLLRSGLKVLKNNIGDITI